ncbi:MAG: hypothetical protein V4437_01310 [Patescibacteria group bacterium]
MNGSRTEMVLDIGSASVGACFIAFKNGEKPMLSHVKRTALRTDSGEALRGIQALAIEALKKTIEPLSHALRPDTLEVTLGAPWYAAKIQKLVSEAEKPIRITESTVAHALLKQRAAESNDSRAERKILESVASHAKVNGYPTALKKMVRGSKLEMDLYESEADLQFVDEITTTLKNAFPHTAITFHTFPLTAFAVLRALRDEQNFTIIDVGGEITDVAFVNNDALSFMGSFPRGGLSFARAIAGKNSIADAMSHMTLFAKGELSEEETASFSKLFSAEATSWNDDYTRIMEGAIGATPIPRATFIIADKESLLWFEKVFSMRNDSFPVKPILITPDFFQEYVTLGEDSVYDSFLSLAALFFTMGQQGLIKG